MKVHGSKKNNIDGKKKKQNVDKEKDMEDRTWYDIFSFATVTRNAQSVLVYGEVRGGGGAS